MIYLVLSERVAYLLCRFSEMANRTLSVPFPFTFSCSKCTKSLKRTLFIMVNRNMWIFGVNPLFKHQNNSCSVVHIVCSIDFLSFCYTHCPHHWLFVALVHTLLSRRPFVVLLHTLSAPLTCCRSVTLFHLLFVALLHVVCSIDILSLLHYLFH